MLAHLGAKACATTSADWRSLSRSDKFVVPHCLYAEVANPFKNSTQGLIKIAGMCAGDNH
jgi:hypothetical protein